MQKIKPFLWFNDQAEEAANFYTSIFKNSSIESIARGSDGTASSARFSVEGQELIAFNGGPHFTFSPAVSLFVNCETQSEVDELWTKLGEGGEPGRCGWLKDKFGLSWQIIPSALGDMLNDDDDAKSERVMDAMLAMSKIDIALLEKAYAQEA